MLDMAKAVDGGAGMTGTDMAPTAAAWCKESRAWRTVSRVWIIADSRWNRHQSLPVYIICTPLTSSSAFLAPRILNSNSRSPSPLFRNESSILASEAGGGGYFQPIISAAHAKNPIKLTNSSSHHLPPPMPPKAMDNDTLGVSLASRLE